MHGQRRDSSGGLKKFFFQCLSQITSGNDYVAMKSGTKVTDGIVGIKAQLDFINNQKRILFIDKGQKSGSFTVAVHGKGELPFPNHFQKVITVHGQIYIDHLIIVFICKF